MESGFSVGRGALMNTETLYPTAAAIPTGNCTSVLELFPQLVRQADNAKETASILLVRISTPPPDLRQARQLISRLLMGHEGPVTIGATREVY